MDQLASLRRLYTQMLEHARGASKEDLKKRYAQPPAPPPPPAEGA